MARQVDTPQRQRTLHEYHYIIHSCNIYRWLNAGVTDFSNTIENSYVFLHWAIDMLLHFALCLTHIIWNNVMLYYVRGEQLDQLCFSASHLIRYWKICYIKCTCNVYVSYCIFWEIKHLNLNLTGMWTPWNWHIALGNHVNSSKFAVFGPFYRFIYRAHPSGKCYRTPPIDQHSFNWWIGACYLSLCWYLPPQGLITPC